MDISIPGHLQHTSASNNIVDVTIAEQACIHPGTLQKIRLHVLKATNPFQPAVIMHQMLGFCACVLVLGLLLAPFNQYCCHW